MTVRFELHGHFISGPTYRVGLMLRLSGEKFDYVHVDLASGAHKQPGFVAKSRYGQVPCLVDHKTKMTLVQSGAILEYLADALGKFGGASPGERQLAREWVCWEDDVLERGILRLRGYRIGYVSAPPDVVAHYEQEGRTGLATLDGFLAGKAWVCGGNQPTFADIYVYGSVVFARDAGFDIAAHRHIAQWVARMTALAHFAPPAEVLPQESRRAK